MSETEENSKKISKPKISLELVVGQVVEMDLSPCNLMLEKTKMLPIENQMCHSSASLIQERHMADEKLKWGIVASDSATKSINLTY